MRRAIRGDQRRGEQRRGGSRGFTLIELMVVVAIIGAMAALAVLGIKRYLSVGTARAEADDAMLAIASAIRSYYDNQRGYLDCSTDFDDFYPMPPTAYKHILNNSTSPEYACWQQYNVRMGPTYMSFAVKAGTKSDPPPQPKWCPKEPKTFTWPANLTGPWFILEGTEDLNGNGVYARYVVSSFAPNDIFRCNEGE